MWPLCHRLLQNMFNLLIGMYPGKLKINPDLPWKYEKPKPPLCQATPSNLGMIELKECQLMEQSGADCKCLSCLFCLWLKKTQENPAPKTGRSIEAGWETHSP